MRAFCDNCVFYRPRMEVLNGDGGCSGECALTGEDVRFIDVCGNHEMDDWFEEE